MQVNLKKLDARIQKLQEIRRIAADPELISLLMEFIGYEEEGKEAVPAARAHAAAAPSPNDAELVDQVLKGMEPQPNGTWALRRG